MSRFTGNLRREDLSAATVRRSELHLAATLTLRAIRYRAFSQHWAFRPDKDKRALTVELYGQKKLSLKKICALMGISKPTLYAYVRESMQQKTSLLNSKAS